MQKEKTSLPVRVMGEFLISGRLLVLYLLSRASNYQYRASVVRVRTTVVVDLDNHGGRAGQSLPALIPVQYAATATNIEFKFTVDERSYYCVQYLGSSPNNGHYTILFICPGSHLTVTRFGALQ